MRASVAKKLPTTDRVTIIVHGEPQSQGSLNVMKSGILYHSRQDALDEWRHAINSACPVPPMFPKKTPVKVEAIFYLPRPDKTRFTYPVKKDLDKLQRAIGDALTADKPSCKLIPQERRRGAYQDDTQIVCWVAVKKYATPDCPCPGGGVLIDVSRYEENEG